MRRFSRSLHVMLVLALLGHGGLPSAQAGSLHAATMPAIVSADTETAASTAEAPSPERDCHGHAPTGVTVQTQPGSSTSCEYHDCASCLCAPSQPVSMTALLLAVGTTLAAELRARLPGAHRASPPSLLLRPPIA